MQVDIVNACVPFFYFLLQANEENQLLFLKLHGLEIVARCTKHMFELVKNENEFLQPTSSPRGKMPMPGTGIGAESLYGNRLA